MNLRSLARLVLELVEEMAAAMPPPAPPQPEQPWELPVWERPHLPPGYVLHVPDGVPPGWPWHRQLPEGWYGCGCLLEFPTWAKREAHIHSSDPDVRAECAKWGRLRVQAQGRATNARRAYRIANDPEYAQLCAERQERDRPWRNEYRSYQEVYERATDPEYAARVRLRDQRWDERERQLNAHRAKKGLPPLMRPRGARMA